MLKVFSLLVSCYAMEDNNNLNEIFTLCASSFSNAWFISAAAAAIWWLSASREILSLLVRSLGENTVAACWCASHWGKLGKIWKCHFAGFYKLEIFFATRGFRKKLLQSPNVCISRHWGLSKFCCAARLPAQARQCCPKSEIVPLVIAFQFWNIQ